MPGPYRNIHGRRGTRGLRPWLLLPKVLAVAGLLGGLGALALILLTAQPRDAREWWALEATATLLYRGLVIPCGVTAVAAGTALLLAQQPGVLLRLRWLRLKLVAAAPTVLALHLGSRALLHALRRALGAGELASARDLTHRLAALTLAGLAMLVLAALLARLKPRLGQNWARDYRRGRPGTETGA